MGKQAFPEPKQWSVRGLLSYLAGARAVWLVALAMTEAAVLIYFNFETDLRPPVGPFELGWWAVAALYCLAEMFVVRYQSARESIVFSLNEVPLVLGFFFLEPGEILVAQLVGAGIAMMLYWRKPVLSVFYGLASASFSLAVAMLVFHSVAALGDPLGPAGWFATLIASATCGALSALLATLSSSLTARRFTQLPRFFGLSTMATVANTCLALVTVAVLWDRPTAAWLPVVLWVMIYRAYRAYGIDRQKHDSLRLLYESSRVGASLRTESVLVELLSQTREMFRCDIAEITVFSQVEGEPALRTTIGPGDQRVLMQPVELDPTEGVWARAVAEGETQLLARPIKNERLRAHYAERNISEAIVAPLRGESGALGAMLVANRVGNLGTFNEDDVRLFETLVNHASVSLENGRLVDSLRRQAAENEHLALHDGLTGLPNRALFQEAVRQAIGAAKREGNSTAVMLMDLDRFKEINDTLGHHFGDMVLQEVAQRLKTCLRESDMVSRLGGDEFAVLLPVVNGATDAMVAARKILHSLDHPIDIEGMSLEIGASIGIALYPEDGDDAETLLQRADVAMYIAKEAHTGAEHYSTERDEYTPDRLGLVSELRRALERDELMLLYQPKADLRNGRVIGFEALMRWIHPKRGFVSPEDFVHIAEHSGLGRELTTYALDSALRECASWLEKGLGLHVSVNIFARSLLDGYFPDEVEMLLRRWDVPPSYLQLEISESSIMADPERSGEILERLSDMGVGLTIDDFGTGYSSLSHIRRLPVSEIKVDSSFILGMMKDENDAVIVRSIVDLGHNLGLSVVAEGVETRGILDALVDLDCDSVQGFYLAHPLPPDRVAAWAEKFTLFDRKDEVLLEG